MSAEELTAKFHSVPEMRPVVVIPCHDLNKITSMAKVRGWREANGEAKKLTSLCGLIRYCAGLEEERTFLIRTS
ncbi:MAG: hypothetical protein KAT70_01515 [Thermoplasmata archaeon]|nr:hypothetical protein [Thermoplasmata archaeon]